MKNKKRNLLYHPLDSSRTRLPVYGAILSLTFASSLLAQIAPSETKEDVIKIEKLVAEDTLEDKALVLPTEPTRSVFGMSQSLAETPSSATVVPSSPLDSLGIRNYSGSIHRMNQYQHPGIDFTFREHEKNWATKLRHPGHLVMLGQVLSRKPTFLRGNLT